MATSLSLTRVNGGLRFVMTFALLLPLSFANAASFDCAKATTLVEKAICGDSHLSARDDALMAAYKHALVEATDANRLKAEQRAWLKNVRNQCQDVGCLIRAYDRRIAELGGHAPTGNEIPRPADSNIVLGRCHMDTCSWWKVERQETIRTSSKGHLVKVLTRSTSEEFAGEYVIQNGYPEYQLQSARWNDPPSIEYLYCSNTLPAYIFFDKEKSKYEALIPFDNDGSSWGYSMDVANLYNYVCNNGRTSTYAINPAYAEAEITLDVPEDILSFK